MNSALSLLLLALIPAAMGKAPPVTSATSVAQAPVATGAPAPSYGCDPNTVVFPKLVDPALSPACTEGQQACSQDETALLTCTGGKWAKQVCGAKNGYTLACRSYAKWTVKDCPIYTECTGYEDDKVPESVTSEAGVDFDAATTFSAPRTMITSARVSNTTTTTR